MERSREIAKDNFDVWTEVSSREPTKPNPFDDPFVADYYRKVYEDAKYECRKAFDPELSWTHEEERKLVRKLDVRVALTSCILFAALQIDRGNLGQAVADNMLDDINMNTNDYNLGNQLFYICFLLAEVPSQLISKKLGPDIFIPIQMVAWSIVAMSQSALTNKTGYLITRSLIGLLEGGFIADLVLWLSYFYTSTELPIRLSFFWTTMSLVQVCTSLLAFLLFRLRGIAGLTGWQWLFLLEGLITLLIGLGGFYLMVPSAVQTRNFLHPKGWFTEREELIVVNRVLRDDPSKGDMHNRQALTPKLIWQALTDYDLWPIYLIGLVHYLPDGTVSPYLTLTLKSVGFSKFTVQLLSIPHSIIFIIFLLGITRFSEKISQRALLGLIPSIWNTTLLGFLRWWSGSLVKAWPTYTILTLLLGAPYIHAICVSWASRNSNSIKTRAISAAVYNMFVQMGSIISNQLYREDDAPLYHRGNEILFWIMAANIPLFILVKAYYMYRNKSRDEKWNSMSEAQQRDYIVNTTDQGNKRLDFRFVH
ncbi:AaceriAFR229Cp [[Ashbya] aceris (nom. inval.)]|nr:AaceriAFR229Cp [[Ashbya] aceris (nom. inval.)]